MLISLYDLFVMLPLAIERMAVRGGASLGEAAANRRHGKDDEAEVSEASTDEGGAKSSTKQRGRKRRGTRERQEPDLGVEPTPAEG
jgi:hypothetical protein